MRVGRSPCFLPSAGVFGFRCFFSSFTCPVIYYEVPSFPTESVRFWQVISKEERFSRFTSSLSVNALPLSIHFRHSTAVVLYKLGIVRDKIEPSCVKCQSSPHPAMLRSTNTHYTFSLRGMESWMEGVEGKDDLAGDVKQNGSCFLPPLRHDAHLGFWKSLLALSWLLGCCCFFFFSLSPSHMWRKPCPAPNQPPSTSPLHLLSSPNTFSVGTDK